MNTRLVLYLEQKCSNTLLTSLRDAKRVAQLLNVTVCLSYEHIKTVLIEPDTDVEELYCYIRPCGR